MSKSSDFRVGRVVVYLRGRTWYLRYHEHGRRRQVRATTDRHASRQLAAQVNAQLESGAPAATSVDPIDLPELRRRWLEHHEHVLRSSLATIDRYRAATEHLLRFVRDVHPVNQLARFRAADAEAFVRYLRQLRVAPNGHPNAAKRCLRDKGLKYALEVCRTMFAFAIKRRHLPPYADNPFTMIQVDRIPVEDAKPITLLTAEQESQFLEACDDWQLQIFSTLMLTGLRPGELTHLLLPNDVDLGGGWIIVRNKPELGWKVKTRNDRRVPLIPELAALLQHTLGDRKVGPVFLRRRCAEAGSTSIRMLSFAELTAELQRRLSIRSVGPTSLTRSEQRRMAARLWTETGMVPEDRLRTEFMKLTRAVGLPGLTAPKSLRHLFATRLQEANVDPLIRNGVMGHAPVNDAKGRGPLGMTAVYSHAGPETVRRQLEQALIGRPVVQVLRKWLEAHAAHEAA